MSNTDKKISNYGFSFQTKLVSSLMTDKSFFSSIYDVLDIKYFDLESIKFLVKISKEYFKEYNLCPTLEVYKVEIEKIKDALLKQEIISALRESVNYIESDDLSYIKSETMEFCKKQEFINAILLAANDVQSNNYDLAVSRIEKATKVGIDTNIGINLIDDIERRYNEQPREPIPTGWPSLNEIMKGGLAKGELGIVITATGGGKSWILSHLGVAAAQLGKTVVHFTLELAEGSVAFRYDCIVSGISLDKIEHYKENVKTALGRLSGKVIIKNYPTKSASLNTIKGHLSKLKVFDIVPDLIIVDYADLLKYNLGNDAKHDALESLYEELRGMAGEFDVPIWSASQINRCHFLLDKVELENGEKINIGDVKVNDKILTHKGYKNVNHVYPIETQPVYKIKLKSGKEINVSAEHLLPTGDSDIKSISTGLRVGDKLLIKK